MAKWTNEFYTGIGTNLLDTSNFDTSIFNVSGFDRIICDPEAFDLSFQETKDYRLKYCASKTFHDYTVIHNLLGHVQYMTHIRNLPVLLRTDVYPELSAAIGGLTSLVMTTPFALKGVE